MKKYIIVLLTALMVLPACNGLLDLRTNGTISMDEVFSNRDRTRGYLNACYQSIPSSSANVGSFTDDAVNSEEAEPASKYDYWYNQGMDAATFASRNWEGSVWTNNYQGIRRCNVFLANIDNATAEMSDTERAGWKAQALTLRAFYYLQLIKRYGQVPLFTTDLGTGHDYATDTKSSVGAVVEQILADCDAAIAAPESEDFDWFPVSNQWAIMTKALAYAIESEAVTLAVSPLWESDNVITKERALQVTATALAEVTSHGYTLWTRSTNDYNAYANYFLTDPNYMNSGDRETIWGGFRVSVWKDCGIPMVDGQNSAGSCPTQELVDAYETINGQPVLDLENPYQDEKHLTPNYNSANTMYDRTKPYENRDPRFYATVFYHGSSRGGSVLNIRPGGNCAIDHSSRRATHTGYYMRKYANDNSNRNSNADGYVRIVRLPALYFNFAEIAYQVEGPDRVISPANLSARDALNRVRERVGMPEIPSGLNTAQFEARYRNERRVEFAMEDDRFFSLRRWKALDQTKYVTGVSVSTSGEYTRVSFDERVSADDKYLLYPIDQSENNKIIKLTGSSWQNPGWEE